MNFFVSQNKGILLYMKNFIRLKDYANLLLINKFMYSLFDDVLKKQLSYIKNFTSMKYIDLFCPTNMDVGTFDNYHKIFSTAIEKKKEKFYGTFVTNFVSDYENHKMRETGDIVTYIEFKDDIKTFSIIFIGEEVEFHTYGKKKVYLGFPKSCAPYQDTIIQAKSPFRLHYSFLDNDTRVCLFKHNNVLLEMQGNVLHLINGTCFPIPVFN